MSGKQSKKRKSSTNKSREAMNATATSVDAVEDFLLPDAGVVVVDEKTAGSKAENKKLPAGIAAKPVAQKSPAEWAYERIILYIQNFEEQLDGEHEVAMGFTGGDAGTLRIEGMGFFAPDLITFYGADDNGIKTQMVQHVSQLTVMLRALPKPKEHQEAQRIGFQLGKGLEANAKKAAAPKKASVKKAPAKKKPAAKKKA